MRLILLIIALATASHAAVFGYSQSAALINSSTVAFSGNVTSGHLLIAWYGAYNGGQSGGFSDTIGNIWTAPYCVIASSSVICVSLAISKSTAADTVTLTSPGPNVHGAVMIGEYTVPASFTLLIGQGCGTTGVYTCGLTTFTITQHGIIPPGTEYMAITGFFDSDSAHSWSSSTGATVEQQPAMAACICAVGFGDHDLTTTVAIASPYTDNYGSAFSLTTSLVGLAVVLQANAGSTGGQYAYGTAQ